MGNLENRVTEADLVEYVSLCRDRYTANSIVPTEEAHSPLPKCLGGTDVVLLTKRDHAIHDVLQTECFQYGTFTGWYLSELVGTEWEARAKEALRMTCSQAGSCTTAGLLSVSEQTGIHNPKYDDVRRDWKVLGGKTPASDLQKQGASNRAKKRNAQVWECLETRARMNAGNLTQYQRARGIDTTRRVRIDVDH